MSMEFATNDKERNNEEPEVSVEFRQKTFWLFLLNNRFLF